MESPATRRAYRCLGVVFVVYLFALSFGLAGPGSERHYAPSLMYPAIAVVAVWGLVRVIKGNRP